jgi:methionyl-tRNA formyltransferase
VALRIAIFGQAAFGKDVALGLADAGHQIVGVYAPLETGRPDPLATEAEDRGWSLFRYKAFRRQGAAIPRIIDEYRALGADLNVLPFTTVILPPEIVDGPKLGSLCFHPSLLPAYRGGAALAWQIILGATEGGVTVFKPDEGVDTGPIVVQRGGIAIEDSDTVSSLYFQKLYTLGVEAMLEAVALVDSGKAQYTAQSEEGASFQGLVTDAVARIEWSRPAREIDRLIRGCDPQPGAWADLFGEPIRLYGSRLIQREVPEDPGTLLGLEDGSLVIAAQGGALAVSKVRVGSGVKLAGSEAELEFGARLG